MDDREGRALDDIRNRQSLGQTLGKSGLASAQVTIEHQDIASGQPCANRFAQRNRGLSAVHFNCLHCTHLSKVIACPYCSLSVMGTQKIQNWPSPIPDFLVHNLVIIYARAAVIRATL